MVGGKAQNSDINKEIGCFNVAVDCPFWKIHVKICSFLTLDKPGAKVNRVSLEETIY